MLSGSCMLLERQMLSPGYPTSSKLPIPKHSKSRISTARLASSLHKTAFSFGKKLLTHLSFFRLAQPYLINSSKRMAWSIRSNVDGSELNPSSADNSGNGTRLIRVLQAFQKRISARLKELRKDLPIKLLFFLVGFYCSTAFATVIGQTGDWDILSAALAVVVVEGIGALMYTGSVPLLNKMRNVIIMFNYWKAGLSLGLFLDSFKY